MQSYFPHHPLGEAHEFELTISTEHSTLGKVLGHWCPLGWDAPSEHDCVDLKTKNIQVLEDMNNQSHYGLLRCAISNYVAKRHSIPNEHRGTYVFSGEF